MRLGELPGEGPDPIELPLWPPILATSGLGSRSTAHAHHAMHLVLARSGRLRIDVGGERHEAAGVLTAPDVEHALDAEGVEVLLVFLDPESHAGAALMPPGGAPLRLVDADARDRIIADATPLGIMREDGVGWTARVLDALGEAPAPPRAIHPRVRKLLRLLPELGAGDDTSLELLAGRVGLSPSRLMHAFTESIGIPLRPYLAWLKVQRAAAAIVSGAPLAEAAIAAGFSDAAHMSRTFRRMLGMTPSALRSAAAS